jgi:hypothetical protein
MTPILHELLQLLTQLLLGVMQMPQPGTSSSGSEGSASSSIGVGKRSASSSDGSRTGSQGSSSTGAKHNQDVSPAAAANAMSCIIAVLLPLATQAVVVQPASTAACDTVAAASSNQSNEASLAADWVPLLLHLTAALERAMRFEVKFGPTQPELLATQLFDGFGDVAGDGPQGCAAWLAKFLLLSPAAHKQYGWLYGQDKGSETSPEDQVPLLQWMLNNAAPEQLLAVQQRLLSVLCTVSKLSLAATTNMQLTHANQAYKGILHTAAQVLTQLLPPMADFGLQAARTAAKAAAASAAISRKESAVAAAAESRDRYGGPNADPLAKLALFLFDMRRKQENDQLQGQQPRQGATSGSQGKAEGHATASGGRQDSGRAAPAPAAANAQAGRSSGGEPSAAAAAAPAA